MRQSIIWQWTAPQNFDRADLALLKAIEIHHQTQSTIGCEPLPTVTRSQLKRLFDEGRIKVNASPIKGNRKLKTGMSIEIEFPPPKTTDLIAEDRPLEILYEDESLLVINKPPGLTVHPSSTQMEGTLVNALLHHIRDLSGIGGVLRPGIVHRIDKPMFFSRKAAFVYNALS